MSNSQRLTEVGAANPPLEGVGKDINEYLAHFVTVADAKAGAFLGASLALATILIGDIGKHMPWAVGYWIALFSVAVSITSAAVALFPRLPSSGISLLFWEDIRSRPSADAYEQEVLSLTSDQLEREYANQNYHVSRVLHRKHWYVRCSIVFFLMGALVAALAYLAPRPADAHPAAPNQQGVHRQP
ncbi:MAG TPA: Pycsar system effector family protein [Thermoanaerobaculia bacterium]|jgi:hypothetical protein|nr:Pycsar system effector family protein [Thermoanaerobaculia bacterium]